MDRCFFCEEQVRSVKWKIAVHFIGRYLMITLDSVFSAGIHKNSSTFDISIKENFRIFDGTVNMAFCCKVYNHIRMFFFK